MERDKVKILVLFAVILAILLILWGLKKEVFMRLPNDPCDRYPTFGYLPNKREMTQAEFAREVKKIIKDRLLAIIAIAVAIQEHGRSGGILRFYGNNWHGAIFAVKRLKDGTCYCAWGDNYVGGKFYTDKKEWLVYFNTLEDSIRFFAKHGGNKLVNYLREYGTKTPGEFSWEDFAWWYIRKWYVPKDPIEAWNRLKDSLRANWNKAVYLYDHTV